MPTGRHFTHCRYCNKEYVCGDCITDNCELGHGKKSCPGYKAWLRQQSESAQAMMAKFTDPNGKVAAASRMLADYHWDKLAEEMSDAELATAILEQVWAKEPIGTLNGALLSAAIERLREKV